MRSADRHRIGKNQISVEEYADRGCAAAHVDDGYAEADLVIDEARQTRGVRAYDQCLDLEMRSPDCGAVVAHRGGARRDDVHVDAEPFAIHAARVADAATVIDREADRHRMNDLTVSRLAQPIAVFQHSLQLAVADFAPRDTDLGLDDARCDRTAG